MFVDVVHFGRAHHLELIQKSYKTLDSYQIMCSNSYVNNQNALILTEDGEPYCVLTVSIPQEPQAPDEFYIKAYSENEGLYEQLVAQGILSLPHRFLRSGYVSVPVCRLLQPGA